MRKMSERDAVTLVQSVIGSGYGECYPASEAVYHLMGGKEAGLTPMQGRGFDTSHWWLRDAEGNDIDVTYGQFRSPFPYQNGTGRGFLTKLPSRRAREILSKLNVPRARRLMDECEKTLRRGPLSRSSW